MLKVLDVDGAVRRVRGGWIATGAAVGLRRRPLRTGRRRARRASSRRCSTTRHRGCRMEFLRQQLDDPAAGAVRALRQLRRAPGPAEVSGAGAAAAAERLLPPGRGRRAAADVADRDEGPRRRVTGKIAAGAGRRPGRALGRLTDAGLGHHGCARCWPRRRADEPGSADLTSALVARAGRLGLGAAPRGGGDRGRRGRRPRLIESLGKQIAGIGRLPLLGALGYADGGPGPRRLQQRRSGCGRCGARSAPSAGRRGAGRPGRPGPAHRRPDRDRLDDDGAPELLREAGRPGRAAAGAGRCCWLTTGLANHGGGPIRPDVPPRQLNSRTLLPMWPDGRKLGRAGPCCGGRSGTAGRRGECVAGVQHRPPGGDREGGTPPCADISGETGCPHSRRWSRGRSRHWRWVAPCLRYLPPGRTRQGRYERRRMPGACSSATA